MGLCKCPKKKVTNQFCFEHRVNVCEYCMVSNHSKCVVQSYLQWLQDSDYDPNCHFCKTELAQGDCIRLTCYHVFHWECLNNYAGSYPSQTPPSGYTCPICNMCIFPQHNAVSPVTEALKSHLLGAHWAKIGLGLPIAENNFLKEHAPPQNIRTSPEKLQSPAAFENKSKSATAVNKNNVVSNHSHMGVASTRPEPYGASYTVPYSSPRKLYDATEHGHFRPSMVDHDENKYKRRSALEFFARWFRSRTDHRGHRKKDPNMFYKRWVILLVLGLIGLITLCILFLKFGRTIADSDPLLDPHLNPNIRIEDIGEEIQAAAENLESKLVNRNSIQKNMKELLPA